MMDDIEPYGNDTGFDFEVDDPFAIPPPLNDSILEGEPFPSPTANQENGEVINPQDNIDVDTTQDSADKKKKRVFKPRVNLNEERLCSKKGIEALKNLCSDVQFKGKGHEASDLNKLLQRFEHWAQCLMPRWPFDNVVQKCEVLGSKSKVKNELKRIRSREDEIMRDELEGIDGRIAGQADAPNEEESPQDVPQERTVEQITDEQQERIRRNRELAYERREAKRRKLEQSQTQSQMGGHLMNAEQENNQENVSSHQPSLTPDKTLDNTMVPYETDDRSDERFSGMQEEIYQDSPMSGAENVFPDNVDSEITEVGDIQSTYNDPTANSGRDGFMEKVDSEDAEVNNIQPENVRCNVSDEDDFSVTPNIHNEKSQEENDDSSDDEILSRSMFDINPTRPNTSISDHTNDTNNVSGLSTGNDGTSTF